MMYAAKMHCHSIEKLSFVLWIKAYHRTDDFYRNSSLITVSTDEYPMFACDVRNENNNQPNKLGGDFALMTYR